jgi:hypothetical protein
MASGTDGRSDARRVKGSVLSDSGANFDVDPDISNFDPASIVNVSIKVRQLKDNCVCNKMGTVYRRCRATGKVVEFPHTLYIEQQGCGRSQDFCRPQGGTLDCGGNWQGRFVPIDVGDDGPG